MALDAYAIAALTGNIATALKAQIAAREALVDAASEYERIRRRVLDADAMLSDRVRQLNEAMSTIRVVSVEGVTSSAPLSLTVPDQPLPRALAIRSEPITDVPANV